jgi:hypothetical protein
LRFYARDLLDGGIYGYLGVSIVANGEGALIPLKL